MTLSAIVRALGGDLYDHGRRANIPGPGHSRHDRSVSLLLSEGRLVIHSFGRSTWSEVRNALRDRGLLDSLDRPGPGPGPDAGDGWSAGSRPSDAMRTETARTLWGGARPLCRQLSMSHLRGRGILRPAPVSAALRHHPGVHRAVYGSRGARLPALLSAVLAPDGALCAVEITYLDERGARASGVALSRKTVGVLPASSAVRLDPDHDGTLLVGEGVFTTLSAADQFQVPGWALLSARNLRTWSPPTEVRRVLVAGDRGVVGERAALALQRRLRSQGVESRIAWPEPPAEDWNEACRFRGREGEGGRGAQGGRMVQSSARDDLP